MRHNEDYHICNAHSQAKDDTSVLAFWKRMLALRRLHNDLFVYGDFDLVNEEDESLFMFTKTWHVDRAFVVCNFSKMERAFSFPQGVKGGPDLLASTVPDAQGQTLKPFEGRVYLI